MTTPQPAATGDHGPPDLEYDLAHDATEQNCSGPDCPPHAPATRPLVQVDNRTHEYDGDYGYDLAHDIPGRRPR